MGKIIFFSIFLKKEPAFKMHQFDEGFEVHSLRVRHIFVCNVTETPPCIFPSRNHIFGFRCEFGSTTTRDHSFPLSSCIQHAANRRTSPTWPGKDPNFDMGKAANTNIRVLPQTSSTEFFHKPKHPTSKVTRMAGRGIIWGRNVYRTISPFTNSYFCSFPKESIPNPNTKRLREIHHTS